MKKVMIVILSLVLLLSFQVNCFAASTSNSEKNSPNSVASPMISTWHYQNDTPLVGTSANYNTFIGRVNKNIKLQNYVAKIGLTGLTAALTAYLPANPLARGIAGSIFYAISNNPVLDTPTLYCEEDTWYYGSSLNYQVCQYWYADAAHTQYVTYTTYFGSFY